MAKPQWDDLGKLLLRITIGGLLVLHGISKLKHGVAPMLAGMEAHHLPRFFGYGVYVGEVVAPIFAIIGLGTRLAGLVIAFNMVVAIAMVHSAQIFELNKGGGLEIELPLLYLLGGLIIALVGAGRISVSRGNGRLD